MIASFRENKGAEMQLRWMSEIPPTGRKYSCVATTYEAYFNHRVPEYATQKYSQRTLTNMLHNAILTGEPIPEFWDYTSSDSENIRINLPPRPQEHREMFRDWYLQKSRRP